MYEMAVTECLCDHQFSVDRPKDPCATIRILFPLSLMHLRKDTLFDNGYKYEPYVA